MIRASVCMATYRGAPFVREQIDSILEQLHADDELVIVDDASPDDTVAVIEQVDDPRVRLHTESANRGYVRTFESAIRQARGKYIMLADQDDVWTAGRLELMITQLDTSLVVAGNYSVLGEEGRMPARRPLRPGYNRQFGWNTLAILVGYRPYFGCAMGFRCELVPDLVPFPEIFIESHDLWLAILGNATRSISHLSDVVVERRLHDYNVTPLKWRPLGTILTARLMLARGMLIARRRVRMRPPRSIV
ncbi:glycosyltransferase [Agreia bicolorata]|nr:glycosyltransferase [Agreia bicolorata]